MRLLWIDDNSSFPRRALLRPRERSNRKGEKINEKGMRSRGRRRVRWEESSGWEGIWIISMTTSYTAIAATPLTPQPGSGPHVILTPPSDDYFTGSSCGSSSSSPPSSCCCTCASLSTPASVWGVTGVEGVTGYSYPVFSKSSPLIQI